MGLYILSAGQELLSSLRWCSSCTSGSDGVFLMYLRREIYSMSIYSSAIFQTLSFDEEISYATSGIREKCSVS